MHCTHLLAVVPDTLKLIYNDELKLETGATQTRTLLSPSEMTMKGDMNSKRTAANSETKVKSVLASFPIIRVSLSFNQICELFDRVKQKMINSFR